MKKKSLSLPEHRHEQKSSAQMGLKGLAIFIWRNQRRFRRFPQTDKLPGPTSKIAKKKLLLKGRGLKVTLRMNDLNNLKYLNY